MAKKLKAGDAIRGYRITKVFGPGMMAISYAAQSRTGQKVFFKQYKSPAPTVVWYEAFVNYQKELSERVRSGKAGHYAVRQLDAFEERWGGPCYFQAYEFVENGADLQQMRTLSANSTRTRSAPARDPQSGPPCQLGQSLHRSDWACPRSRCARRLKPAKAYMIEDDHGLRVSADADDRTSRCWLIEKPLAWLPGLRGTDNTDRPGI